MQKLYRFITLISLILMVVLSAGCAASAEVSDDSLSVFVSIVPQGYFVERIGGDLVDVEVMVEAGASPATYEPKPEQMAALSEAEAYFSIGVPFEASWLDRIASASEDMLMVDTAEGVERMAMTAPHTHEEEGHEEEGHEEDDHADEDHDENEHHEEEAEGSLDPHIWVSPALVKIQAENIHAALVEMDPENEAAYDANLASFIADIDALDADIRAALENIESNKFMVFHPSWGYFADDYGLEMVAIEVGGTEPSAAELADLISEAQEEGIQVVFAQPEFSTEDAETIANEIGGEVLLISPLAPDWLANLRSVVETLAKVLG